MPSLTLEQLKNLVQNKIQKEFIQFSLLPSGIPRGAITSISGSGKSTFILKFLAENSQLNAAWIESKFSIYPLAFLQRNIDLQRVLFIEAGEELNWVVLQVLKAQAFPVVVVYAEELSLKALRRIQLTSETAHAATIWLTQYPQKLWPIFLEVQVQRAESGFQSQIIRQRSG